VTQALVAQARESSGLQIVSREEIRAQLKAATTCGRVQGRAEAAMPRPQIVITLAGGEAGDKYVLRDKANTQVATARRAKRRAEKRRVDSGQALEQELRAVKSKLAEVVHENCDWQNSFAEAGEEIEVLQEENDQLEERCEAMRGKLQQKARLTPLLSISTASLFAISSLYALCSLTSCWLIVQDAGRGRPARADRS
jgi:hypothetical protein